MKRTEIILAVIGLVSYILIQFDVPGFRLLFFFSMSILSFIYLFFSYCILNDVSFLKLFKKSEKKEAKNQNTILSILFGLFSSTLVCGLIFKANHYQGEKTMILYGLIPITIISIIVLLKNTKTKTRFNMNLLKRGATLFVIGVIMLLK